MLSEYLLYNVLYTIKNVFQMIENIKLASTYISILLYLDLFALAQCKMYDGHVQINLERKNCITKVIYTQKKHYS